MNEYVIPNTNRTIIILPDGETWSLIDGCTIAVLSATEFHKLANNLVDVNDVCPITMTEWTEVHTRPGGFA